MTKLPILDYIFFLEHPQQWIYNFSYLAPIKVTLSILPTHMLQQWIYFRFQYNKIILASSHALRACGEAFFFQQKKNPVFLF